MKEKILAEVQSRVGIPADQAEKVVDTVLDYLKKNPDQVSGLLGTKGGAGGIGGRLSGMFKR